MSAAKAKAKAKRRPKRDATAEQKVIGGFVRAAAAKYREVVRQYEEAVVGEDDGVDISLRVVDKRIGDQEPRVITVLLQLDPNVFVGIYQYLLGRANLAMFQFSDLVRALSPELYRLVENTLDLERRWTCVELFLREVAPPGAAGRLCGALYTLPGEDSIQIVTVFPMHQVLVNYVVSEVLGNGDWSKLRYTLANLEMMRQMTCPDITRGTMTYLYNMCVEAELALHASNERIDEKALDRIRDETAPRTIAALIEKSATTATYFGLMRKPREEALEVFVDEEKSTLKKSHKRRNVGVSQK